MVKSGKQVDEYNQENILSPGEKSKGKRKVEHDQIDTLRKILINHKS